MKRWRNVIILGLVLAVLVAAYFLLKGKEAAGNPEPSPTPGENPEAVSLLGFQRDDIEKIILEYEDGHKVVLEMADKDVEFITIEDDGTETVTINKVRMWDTKDYPVDQNVVNNIVYGGVNARTNRLIDADPQDLSIYGLDKPVTVTFFNKDGESETIQVGNATPTGDYYYVKKGDGKEVYTLVSYLAEYLKPDRFSLISKMLYHRSDLTYEDMTELTFYRDGELVFSAYLKNPPVDWLITEPLEISVNLQNMDRFLRGLADIKASRVVDDLSSDLEQYGLDEPRCVFRYTLGDRQYELKIGKREGAEYYAMMEGKNFVFTVSASSLNFLDVPLRDVVQLMVYTPSIFDMSKLVIELDGRTDVLEMDISQPFSENDVYIFNGTKIEDKDDQTLFRKYYQGAIALSGDRIDLAAKPEGEPEVRLTYTSKAGEVTVVELVPTPDGFGYYAMKNGKYTGLVVGRRELDKDNMGIRQAYENLMEGLKD